MTRKAVATLSGGMDSTTLAYHLHHQGYRLHLVSVDYGQRHRRELHHAAVTARRLDARHSVVDLSGLATLLHGSALTSRDVEVPEGHYAAPTMAATVVPNRNAILLSVAVGAAVADGAELVAAGVHAGDHPVYPDCRPAFIDALDHAARVGTEGHAVAGFRVEAPFVTFDKAAIARLGDRLGVPWRDTWSCYQGGDVHCGRCSTCVERIEAFTLAGVHDPTEYADPHYAKTVT